MWRKRDWGKVPLSPKKLDLENSLPTQISKVAKIRRFATGSVLKREGQECGWTAFAGAGEFGCVTHGSSQPPQQSPRKEVRHAGKTCGEPSYLVAEMPGTDVGDSRVLEMFLLLLSCWVVSDSLDPMDCSPPGSSAQGISQARILERIAISFSLGSSWWKDRARVSSTGRQVLHRWTTGEAPQHWQLGCRLKLVVIRGSSRRKPDASVLDDAAPAPRCVTRAVSANVTDCGPGGCWRRWHLRH